MIDITLDFSADANGRDPDRHSPTLRRYHQLMWSKALPNGVMFDLVDAHRGSYLYHESEIGRFWLASDTIAQSLSRRPKIATFVSQLSVDEIPKFRRRGGTIGGRILFPGNRIDAKATINGARGFHPRVGDRFDLTLETIRRHYVGVESPLTPVLARYADFFALFADFRGYVDFFLLQDLVSEDYTAVQFFSPFQDFSDSPLPRSLEEYRGYLQSTLAFVDARNRRMTEALAPRSDS
ncbi:DUF6994 family protein [Agromyces sp. NPDC055661]